jgi:hypothetical protein
MLAHEPNMDKATTVHKNCSVLFITGYFGFRLQDNKQDADIKKKAVVRGAKMTAKGRKMTHLLPKSTRPLAIPSRW